MDHESPTHLRIKVVGIETKDGVNVPYDRHDQTACGTIAINRSTTDAPDQVTCEGCVRVLKVVYGQPNSSPAATATG